MLVLGEADFRTPPGAGGEEMFRALKFLKRPVIMVRFPNESHELSRSGQPWHRIERLEHIVGWFDKWLMGWPNLRIDGPRKGFSAFAQHSAGNLPPFAESRFPSLRPGLRGSKP